jgi:hypothetical protein
LCQQQLTHCWEWTRLFDSPEVIVVQDLSDERSRSLDAYCELQEAHRSGDTQRILRAEKAVAVVQRPVIDFFAEIIRRDRLKPQPSPDTAAAPAADPT